MGQQAARRSALDAQAARRKECVDRERRLEGLAVEVLTALGERDTTIAATRTTRRGGVAGDDQRRTRDRGGDGAMVRGNS
jgi:hypothetical protein